MMQEGIIIDPDFQCKFRPSIIFINPQIIFKLFSSVPACPYFFFFFSARERENVWKHTEDDHPVNIMWWCLRTLCSALA